MIERWHHTTICAVRRGAVTALACDGQVTLGTTVLKHGATKLRRLGDGRVLAGFAGSVADALSLFSRFEAKLEEYSGNLERAAVELARDWRTDKVLRQLEAMMIVADAERVFLLSGTAAGAVLTKNIYLTVAAFLVPFLFFAWRAYTVMMIVRRSDTER